MTASLKIRCFSALALTALLVAPLGCRTEPPPASPPPNPPAPVSPVPSTNQPAPLSDPAPRRVPGPVPVPVADTNPAAPFVGGNAAFTLDLFSALNTNRADLFFSPYSVMASLGLAHAGARGETLAEMTQVLRFSDNQWQNYTMLNAVRTGLAGADRQPGADGAVANALWVQEGHALLPEFLEIITNRYFAEVNQADFRARPEPVRQEINAWVGRQTHDKISDLIAPGTLNETVKLVLVNAIYFKGRWAAQFPKVRTADAPFAVAHDKNVTAQLMNAEAEFRFADIQGMQMLELPFQGGNFSMVVLLPVEPDLLRPLESVLSENTLNMWLKMTRKQKVNVFLPRFKLTAQYDLVKPLTLMGMGDAFSPQADFSGIDGARDLFISAVVHKAVIEVNEEGAEAAAATGTVVALKSVALPVPVFRADHPFLFLIRETHSGNIVFFGRVWDPTQ